MSRDPRSPSRLRPVLVWATATTGCAAALPPLVRAAADPPGPAPGAAVPPFDDVLVAACAGLLAVALVWLWAQTTAVALEVVRSAAGVAPPRARPATGALRRVLLVACGAAVLSTTPAVAGAAGGVGPGAGAGDGDGTRGGVHAVSGLPLPDRPVHPGAVHPGPVHPGDVHPGPVHPGPVQSAPVPGAAARSSSATGPATGTSVARAPQVRVVAALPPAAGGAAGARVRVRPGDTLWDLAAARLPRAATDADIDRAWRALWAANRSVVGPDPHLIHPGTSLVVTAVERAR